MSLIVETGAGLTGAESYLSVADFRLYVVSRYGASDPVPDDEIEQALRRATRYIDGRYRHRFLGYPSDPYVQSLEWPRVGVVLQWLSAAGYFYGFGYNTPNGLILSNTIVPQQIKNATAEAAIRELASSGSLTPDRNPSRQVIQQVVGPISTTYANVADARPIVTVIDELLAPLLSATSAYSGSLVRA